ncbi:MFS transporter [uncultured Microbacterium sp.]|uniref:MFS transporter n=1 Tax=uncultured Microbacterium sp. TaxID=191216 RepID=UPI0035CBB71B
MSHYVPAVSPPPQTHRTIDETIDNMKRVGLTRGAWVALMLAFMFASYDIVVFALTVPSVIRQFGILPTELALPVALNLLGYAVGAYIFGQLSDRRGRQLGLFLTFALLAVGAFLSAFAWDIVSLGIFRFLAGAGMGSVLSLCAGYVGEMAPSNQRGKYLSKMTFVAAVLVTALGFPSLAVLAGLPEIGWRILYGFGAFAIVLLFFINKRSLIESPRWLVIRGRTPQAADNVRILLLNAGEPTLDDVSFERAATTPAESGQPHPLRTLLRRGLIGRLLVVLGFWFIFYIAFYGFNSYLPLILEAIGINTSNALSITVFSRVLPILGALAVVFLIERIERRTLVIVGTVTFAVGMLCIISGLGDAFAIVGTLIAQAGIAVLITPAYAYTAELFPTAVRGTAASIGDGVGHLGGAVAGYVILPVLVAGGPVAAGATISGLLLVSAIIVRFGPRTRNRSLVEIAAEVKPAV